MATATLTRPRKSRHKSVQQQHDAKEGKQGAAGIDYGKLVLDAAYDKSIDSNRATKVLQAANKSIEDYEADINAVELRLRQGKSITDYKAIAKEAAIAATKLEEAKTERKEVVKPLDEKIENLESQLRSAGSAAPKAQAAKRKLHESSPEWLRDLSHETSVELNRLLGECKRQPVPDGAVGMWDDVDDCYKPVSIYNPELIAKFKEFEETLAEHHRHVKEIQPEIVALKLRKEALEQLAIENAWPLPCDWEAIEAKLSGKD